MPNSQVNNLLSGRFTRKKIKADNTKLLGAATQYVDVTAKWRLWFATHGVCAIKIYPVNSCEKRILNLFSNPLPSITLQSARDLNVPCRPKRSKALLLPYTFKYLLKKRSLSAHAVGL
jgi:hypothetical protein